MESDAMQKFQIALILKYICVAVSYVFVNFVLGMQSLLKFSYERIFNWQFATYI